MAHTSVDTLGMSTSTFAIDQAIANVARKQLGLISVKQATELGISRRSIRVRVVSNVLIPTFSSVYRLASAESSVQQRALGACLSRPGAVLAGRWAAMVHEFPLPSSDLDYFDVMLSVEATHRVRQRGITVIRHRHEHPHVVWRTVGRVTTPAATLLELSALRGDDRITVSQLSRCVDHCVSRRLIVVDEVLAWLASLPAQRVPGRQILSSELSARTNGVLHRSRLEMRVGRWLTTLGLTGWTSNYRVPVPRGEPIEVDFAWVNRKVALEVSPFYTHGSMAKQQRDLERRAALRKVGWSVIEADDRHVVSIATFQTIADEIARYCVPSVTRKVTDGTQ